MMKNLLVLFALVTIAVNANGSVVSQKNSKITETQFSLAESSRTQAISLPLVDPSCGPDNHSNDCKCVAECGRRCSEDPVFCGQW